MAKIYKKMNKKQQLQYAIISIIFFLCILVSYSYGKRAIKKFILATISIELVSRENKKNSVEEGISLLNNINNSHNHKIAILERLNDYGYARDYSGLRKNVLEFDNVINKLENNFLTEEEKSYIEKFCLFQVEEAVDRITIAKAYDCLSRIQAANKNVEETYRAIKHSSYALDILYNPKHASNLASIIVKDYKKEILSSFREFTEKDILIYFTGYAKDEIPFLKKLTTLNIPSLSAKAFYRLSMIYLLGSSSALEQKTINLTEAVLMQNKAIELSKIKAINITNIAFTINDKYAVHAATTIVSALLNSDLDSFYNFYFVMDAKDSISLDAQQKLSSMQKIRPYKTNFLTVDETLLPMEMVKKKISGTAYPYTLIAYRLFFDKIFPNIDFILSLDADLLVLRDLSYFKTIDMTDYFVAGSYDCFCPVVQSIVCRSALPNIYINAGVMWFALNNMRFNKAINDIREALQNSSCGFVLLEQDTINVAFHDRIKYLAQRWDHMEGCDVSTTEALNHHVKFIVHYSGRKPWKMLEENGGKLEQLNEIDRKYWFYRALTPWGT